MATISEDVLIMKRLRLILNICGLTLLLALLLSACGQAVTEQGSGKETEQSQGLGEASDAAEIQPDTAIKAENVDLSNMDDVTAAFLAPLNNDCLYYSWADASGIREWHLLNICSRNNLLNLPTDNPIKWHAVPEQEVVSALQRHFDFTPEHLRTSFRYNKDKQTYYIDRIEEEESVFRAISATQEGSRIRIEIGLTVPDPGETPDKQSTMLAQYAAVNYQPYGQGMLIFPSGTVTVEVGEDDTVRYLSYEFNEQFERETEKLALYRKYVEAFKFPVGRESWDDPMQIEPDAFVVYYIYLCGTGEVEMPVDVPIEEEYGNPYMPQEDLEKAVMSHFDVTPEHIRKSEYYDKEKGFYWSGGIGTLVDMEIVGARWEGNRLTLTVKSCIISSESTWRWNNEVVLEVDGEDYKYISYTSEQVEGG